MAFPLALFSSVRFGIVLMSILFVYCSIGSAGVIFPSNGELVYDQLRQWRPFEMTEFEWFHWWPFDLLMVLMALNITVTTLRRIPLKAVNYGVWLIHGGILMMMLGCWIYFGTKVEGDAPVVRRMVTAELLGPAAAGAQPAVVDRATVIASPGQRFSLTDGRSAHVIVKLPIGPAEYLWTTGMEGLDAPEGPHCELEYGCTPRVFAAGSELGGYDLAWIVVERLGGQPLSHHFNGNAARDLLTAAVNWYDRAANLRPIHETDRPRAKDWSAQIAKARASIEDNVIADESRWIAAIERARAILPDLTTLWESRPLTAWCHGDLHPGNAMRRTPVADGPGHTESAGAKDEHAGQCVLIDLALVHAGHWVEDAVYLERLCWSKPEILEGVRPVEFVADLLRTRGMLGGEDYGRLANARRILMAATSPAYLAQDGNPRYMHAALERLESGLDEFNA